MFRLQSVNYAINQRSLGVEPPKSVRHVRGWYAASKVKMDHQRLRWRAVAAVSRRLILERLSTVLHGVL